MGADLCVGEVAVPGAVAEGAEAAGVRCGVSALTVAVARVSGFGRGWCSWSADESTTGERDE